jgi:hypothetical protein
MSTNELIARLVEALAWPVSAFIIVLFMRKPIINLLRNVGKMKWQGVEFEFNKDLENAEKDAKQINLPPANDMKNPLSLPPNSYYEQTMALATIAPRAAVTEAWRAIEIATAEAAKAHGYEVRGSIAGINVIHHFISDGKLDQATEILYERLRRLRGQSAHAPDFQIGSDEAIRYVDLALGLANRLQNLADIKPLEEPTGAG